MVYRLNRLMRQLRQKKSLGIGLLLLILVVSIVGNALTFYFFDRASKPDLTVGDAFWYSVISIATIGYGDLSSTSVGARIGTAFFIVFVGLAAFTSAVGVGIDWLLELRDKERSGMGS
ncbi:MAG: two pore domain potassium channel family protein, partial [SAR202 cluster bacterium]|nr:two pore domain potassium channel family protein [SAR202 cluster bacterium]